MDPKNNERDRKELIQQVIERILYCEGYLEELNTLNDHYDPHKKVKYTANISEFLFPLEHAIH